MIEPTVWVDGRMRAAGEQLVPAMGAGYAHGRGLFETLRLQDGEPVALARHLARLSRCAPRLGLEVPARVHLLEAISVVAATRRPESLSRMKIQLSAGIGARPTLLVSAQPVLPAPTAMTVAIAPSVRNERSPLAGIKSTAYAENLLALEWAQTQGADEALLADSRGRLSEGSMTNVFLSLDGAALLTPALSTGALPGIGRERLLEWLPSMGVPVEEVEVPISVLGLAREMFVVNAVRGVVPVAAIDGHPLAVPGPLTERAARCFERRSSLEVGLPSP